MSWVDLDGVRTYYEARGAGHPVVLLHGALSGGSVWGAQLEALTDAGFRTLTPHRRGHGRTPDTTEPFSYQAMVEETVGFIESVAGEAADVVGWSDGAVVGALIAMQRPDLVRRLVLIGQYFRRAGAVDGGLTSQLIARRDDPPEQLRSGYAYESPDGPEHFDAVYAKTVDMLAAEPEIEFDALSRITAPTLVVQADHDEVRLDHSIAVVQAIAGARLAVIPGTHAAPVESPSVVNPLLVSFLSGGPFELALDVEGAEARGDELSVTPEVIDLDSHRDDAVPTARAAYHHRS